VKTRTRPARVGLARRAAARGGTMGPGADSCAVLGTYGTSGCRISHYLQRIVCRIILRVGANRRAYRAQAAGPAQPTCRPGEGARSAAGDVALTPAEHSGYRAAARPRHRRHAPDPSPPSLPRQLRNALSGPEEEVKAAALAAGLPAQLHRLLGAPAVRRLPATARLCFETLANLVAASPAAQRALARPGGSGAGPEHTALGRVAELARRPGLGVGQLGVCMAIVAWCSTSPECLGLLVKLRCAHTNLALMPFKRRQKAGFLRRG
jgi:hypothetical protein